MPIMDATASACVLPSSVVMGSSRSMASSLAHASHFHQVDARTQETAATLINVFQKSSPRASLNHLPTSRSSLLVTPPPLGSTTNKKVVQEQGITASVSNSSVGSLAVANDGRNCSNDEQVTNVVGVGVNVNNEDNATDSALSALQDALSKADKLDTSSMYLQHVKIGVPPSKCHQTTSTATTMHVDLSRVKAVISEKYMHQRNSYSQLDCMIPSPTVSVCVGGLEMQDSSTTSTQPTAQLDVTKDNNSNSANKASDQVLFQSKVNHNFTQSSEHNGTTTATNTTALTHAYKQNTNVVSDDSIRNSSSIDLLACISAQLREQSQPLSGSLSNDLLPKAVAPSLSPICTSTNSSVASLSNTNGNSVTNNNTDSNSVTGNYNYKKLPPGRTLKNNKRLFVKHTYRDYSHEPLLPDEVDLFGERKSLTRTLNAAFPLKLHEILTQIEQDGNDDIIGWLDHGRSFKIFKQKEFVDTILPKYFVMRKKSSFQRQLNLYGFNRLSGVGPDQGSYYHEKFLRGLKFLTRRMQRQKVNGNGIRAAGNPDDEPPLRQLPVCPPQHEGNFMVESQQSIPMVVQSIHTLSTPEAMQIDVHASSLVRSSPIAPLYSSTSAYDTTATTRDNECDVKYSCNDTTDVVDDTTPRNCNGYQVSFPLKLQRILDKLEAEGKTDAISWLDHGRAFIIHNSDQLVRDILSVYFNQSKLASFQRQLHMYSMQRITTGKYKGAYHHANFQRGQPQLAVLMQRTRVNGRGTRKPSNPLAEPQFDQLDPLPRIPLGTKIEIPTDNTMPWASVSGSDNDVCSDSVVCSRYN